MTRALPEERPRDVYVRPSLGGLAAAAAHVVAARRRLSHHRAAAAAFPAAAAFLAAAFLAAALAAALAFFLFPISTSSCLLSVSVQPREERGAGG